MQEINTEYAFACARILKGENLSTEDVDEQIRLSEEYRQVIEKIINLPNVIVFTPVQVTGQSLFSIFHYNPFTA